MCGCSGDVVQGVKIADFIQKFISSSSSEELKNEAVIIVVKDDKNNEIASRFVKDINPKIQVKKITELWDTNISCCIEVGYNDGEFDWEKWLSFPEPKPPIIVMPEYDNDINRPSELRIKGGFYSHDVGVIPSSDLLEATEGEEISNEVLQKAFERLDAKIQSYLAKDFKSYLAQREQRDFTYQYSHDKTKYRISSRESSQDEYAAPVDFFLQEHVMLMGNSKKSQDVLCIGESHERKFEALERLKNDLIEKKYTRISFINLDINIDTEREIVIHNSDNNGGNHKEYRVLYSSSIPYSSMQVLPLIASDIVGVTGDQSLVEAMSAKKLVTYECANHKIKFVEGYLESVRNEVSKTNFAGTTGDEVNSLALFLIKPILRCDNVKYEKKEVPKLLSNRNTVEALKKINRQLVQISQYFACIEKILKTKVLPYIKAKDEKMRNRNQDLDIKIPNTKVHKLAQLLKELCKEVENNKTESERWKKRAEAAKKLKKLTENNYVISERDTQTIKEQLETIKQNEPSWQERSLITKILDILSLGIIPIIRCLFFTPNKTMDCVEKIEGEVSSLN